MSGTLKLEVKLDEDRIDECIDIDLTEVSGSEVSGRAEADLDAVLEKVVTNAELRSTNVFTPISTAVIEALADECRGKSDQVQSYTVTLEIQHDDEKLREVIDTEFSETSGGELVGEARVEIEDIITDVITGTHLVEASAPPPVPLAVEYAVNKSRWEANTRSLIEETDKSDTVRLEESDDEL
jgi:hypothetical protein